MLEVDLKVPQTIVSKLDMHRVERELEALDSYIRQNRIRGAELRLPKITAGLDAFAQSNEVQLLDDSSRQSFMDKVHTSLSKAPVTHISFSLEPSVSMIEKITVWFRQNIHPVMMIQVGLQPTIGAGCIVRTENKVFDFSLRQHLFKNTSKLVESIHAHGEPAEAREGHIA
jgi:hypothetical protein